MTKKIKFLMSKPGLDGHDLGAKYVSAALRDAGMEVVYLGLQQTPEQVVNAALQEDADVIGCSFLSGAHLGWMAKIMGRLRKAGLAGIPVLVGGAIPRADIEKLKELGVSEVFPTTTPTDEIVAYVTRVVDKA
ncbi:cobalamin B12-binding domain-containing protein [Thermodesulfobacteriota bacterium]